ncbi:MAG: HAD family hydrolase [Alphaproteobacteria bacterium]|nr:HAD family hydrolase [Alphaproteobacteria bacterium]
MIKFEKPDLILFDWDNTLLDTTPILYKSYCELRKYFNIPEYTMEEYQKMTGFSMRESFPNLFGEKWEEAKSIFLATYQKYHLEYLQIFPKTQELLEFCSRFCKMGIVSNKTSLVLRKEIEVLGWDKYFVAIVGAGDAKKDKPAPDPVYLAIEKYGYPVKTTWFVGDGDSDVKCAKSSGCCPVRISQKIKDEDGVLVVKNLEELLLILYTYEI